MGMAPAELPAPSLPNRLKHYRVPRTQLNTGCGWRQQVLYVALLTAKYILGCHLKTTLSASRDTNGPPRQLTVVRASLGNSVSSRDTTLPRAFNGLRYTRMTWGRHFVRKLTSAVLAPRWSIWGCIWENSAKMMLSYCPENIVLL